MSIYFFETDAAEQAYLSARLPGETLRFQPGPLTTAAQAQEIAADADIVSPFVHSKMGADVIESLPHLKMIATRRPSSPTR